MRSKISNFCQYPLMKRLSPLLYGAIASLLVVWCGGNWWIEATAPVAGCIMLVTAIIGGIITRRDHLDNSIAWFIEMMPAAVVLLLTNKTGLSDTGSADHMASIAIWLGVIIISPFIGGALRYLLSSE